MKLRSRRIKVLVLLVLVWSSTHVPDSFSQSQSKSVTLSEEPKRVLLLFAEDQSFPFMMALQQSIKSTLLTQAPASRFEFYNEHLDRMRIPDVAYEAELVRFWQKKYEGRKIDLIFVCVASALDLLSRHPSELFPGVPLVFCVISQQEVSGIHTSLNVTGVWSAPPFRPTMELALRLHPGTRRVMVVTGMGEFDTGLLAIAKRDFDEFENEKLEVVYLADLTIGELQQRLASLPKQTIVIHLSYSKDRAGVISTGPEIVSKVASASIVPVYGISRTYLSSGIVGGSLISFEDMGVRAAEIGTRILAGESPQNIAPQSVPTALLFDWRQMRRWGVSENSLPPGSIVLYKELSIWELYKWRIVGLLAFCVLQALLIAVLLIERRKRQRAIIERERGAEELQKTRNDLAHVARLTAMGEMAASIAHEVNQPLAAIATYGDACVLLLSGDSPNVSKSLEAIDHIIKDSMRASEVVKRIRGLVKKTSHERTPQDLNQIIMEMVAVTEADVLTRSIQLELNLAPDLPLVLGDCVELQQVVLNLMLNGIEAMSEVTDRARKLTITSSMNGGRQVVVTVRDSGVGLDSEHSKSIFDPFVTTKANGLGLGLSISRTILEVHGGRLWAEPSEGPGASFHFTLPTVVGGDNGH
jgi:signal transduction histidine kinase